MFKIASIDQKQGMQLQIMIHLPHIYYTLFRGQLFLGRAGIFSSSCFCLISSCRRRNEVHLKPQYEGTFSAEHHSKRKRKPDQKTKIKMDWKLYTPFILYTIFTLFTISTGDENFRDKSVDSIDQRWRSSGTNFDNFGKPDFHTFLSSDTSPRCRTIDCLKGRDFGTNRQSLSEYRKNKALDQSEKQNLIS